MLDPWNCVKPTADDWALLKAAVARLQEQVAELEKVTAPGYGWEGSYLLAETPKGG